MLAPGHCLRAEPLRARGGDAAAAAASSRAQALVVVIAAMRKQFAQFALAATPVWSYLSFFLAEIHPFFRETSRNRDS